MPWPCGASLLSKGSFKKYERENSLGLSNLDYFVLAILAAMLVSIALYVSQEKAVHKKDTQDYFLAGKSLPWWAISYSLIAANISAEQIIGMSRSGVAIGQGIASYEWMAAHTLIIVGTYFLRIFLEKRIHTTPQFLEMQYSGRVRSVMAVFWLGEYTFVNLTSFLWLGSLTVNTLADFILIHELIILVAFAAIYSLQDGFKALRSLT